MCFQDSYVPSHDFKSPIQCCDSLPTSFTLSHCGLPPGVQIWRGKRCLNSSTSWAYIYIATLSSQWMWATLGKGATLNNRALPSWSWGFLVASPLKGGFGWHTIYCTSKSPHLIILFIKQLPSKSTSLCPDVYYPSPSLTFPPIYQLFIIISSVFLLIYFSLCSLIFINHWSDHLSPLLKNFQ